MRSAICLIFLLAAIAVISIAETAAQTVVDKTVAVVDDGVNTELITLSDLRWQLALQPNVPLDPPSSEDLNRALQTQVNIRIFALEAERLPRTAPTEAEIAAEISRVLAQFPSTAEFESRLRAVGFTSVKDDNFQRLMAQRVAIEKYQDFRFRSFIVITAEDEAAYYRNVWAPDFRRRFPGVIVPSFEEKRTEIVNELRLEREFEGIETFLDEAKRRVEIVMWSEI